MQGLQNREGNVLSLELRALFKGAEQRRIGQHKRTDVRLRCNALTGSEAAVMELKIAPRPVVCLVLCNLEEHVITFARHLPL